MRNKHCFIWNMARNNKNVENKNAHCRTWSMAGKLKKVEYLEMSTVGHGVWQEN